MGDVVRVVLAVGIGLAIAAFGIGLFRQFAPSSATSNDNAPADVPARFGLGYLCEVCGLELSVIRVARPDAPKHCGEPMAVIQRTPG